MRRHALIETKGTPSLGMFERSPTVSRDLRNEGSHVSRAQAIHCKRKRPLCMHPPVPAVPSRAVCLAPSPFIVLTGHIVHHIELQDLGGAKTLAGERRPRIFNTIRKGASLPSAACRPPVGCPSPK